MQNPTTSSSGTPTTSNSVATPSLLTSGGVVGSPAAVEGAGGLPTSDQQPDLRSLTMQQQLLQAIQLQQSLNFNTSSAPSSGGVPANVLALYQQLISQQLAQPQPPVAVTPATSQPGGITGLPQQFNATLQLQSSTSPSLHRPSTSVQQTTPTHVFHPAPQNPQQQQPSLPLQLSTATQATLNTSNLISQLLAQNPNSLQQLLAGGGQQPNSGAASQIIPLLLSAIASQQHQQQQQQLQQQQLLQQMLQNPLAAANVYLYQNLLQQQQQQQAGTVETAQPQLNLLMQLASQLTGNQQPLSQLITSWLAQQQQQQAGHQTPPQQPLQHPSAAQALPAEIQQLLLRYGTKEAPQQPDLEQPKTGHPNTLSLLQAMGMSGMVDSSGSVLLSSSAASSSSTHPQTHAALYEQQHPTFIAGLSAEEQSRLQLQASQHTPTSAGAPERQLTNAESVQDHISRLISENEAIVEPNPVLLKRRPYHRQSTSNSINSQNSQECIGGSQRGSPGSQLPKTNTTRSHSLHESPLLNSLRLGGSLTSGQPIIRSRNTNSLTCNFCNLKFPNEAGLEAHEFRCSKKEQQLTKQHSQPQLRQLPQLGGGLSHPPQQALLRHLQQQQKLLAQQQHQSNIAALVGGGMGVAPELVLGSGLVDARSATTIEQHQQFLQTMSSLTNATPDELSNRLALKKRLLDSSGLVDDAGDEGSSQQNCNMVIDVVSADDEPASSSSSGSKVAKMDYGADIELLQRLILQKRPVTTSIATTVSTAAENKQFVEGSSTSMSSTLSVLQQIADSANTQRQREQQRLLIASQKAIIQKAAAEYAAAAAGSGVGPQTRRNPLAAEDERSVEQPAAPTISATAAQVTTSVASTAVQPPQPPNSKAPNEMSGMIAYSIECIATRGSAGLPYLLTLGEKIAQEARGEVEPALCSPAVSSTPYRNRNITSDTFVCLNRTRPSDVEQKNCAVSAYSDCWQRGHVDADEEWVIANFLSAGSTKPRMGTGDSFCYTSANKASRSLLTTHSTFWELQNRHGIRASAQELAAAMLIDPKRIRTAIAGAAINQAEIAGTSGNGNVPTTIVALEALVTDELEPPVKKRSMAREIYNDAGADSLASVHPSSAVLKLPATISKATLETTMKMNVRHKEHAKEVDIYVRGRGRGRYVCDRCGIRCKKPSMLKKHLKSHTNDRPYTCITCNFAFKTKGNLTKHLYSKAHRRRMVDSKSSRDERHHIDSVTGRSLMGAQVGAERGVGRLVVDESEDAELAPSPTELCDAPAIRKLTELEAKFVNDDYWTMDGNFDGDDENNDDEEEMEMEAMELGVFGTGLTYRRFGQENILVERSTHTPPTLWGLPKGELVFQWPKSDDDRRCHSAPPVAMCTTEWWWDARRPPKRPSARSTRRIDAPIVQQREEFDGSEQPETGSQPQPSTSSSFLLADSGMGGIIGGGGGSSAGQQQLIANFIPNSILQANFIAQPQATAVVNLGSATQYEHVSQAAAIDLNVLKITQPQLAALIASAILAKSESQTTQIEQQQSGFILPAFAQPTIVHPPIQQPNDVSALGNFVTSEEYPCTMCDKKFRKESELNLHKQTHIIENQAQAKSRNHCCPECKLNLKTKMALSKHIESAHSGNANATVNSNDETEIDQPSALGATSQNSSSGGTSLGFRSFVCNDCNLGFRSNGVLGKHLRSKNHVRALITQGKLPTDAANLIKDHPYILAKIDATDCESAKSSLLSLLEKVRGGDGEAVMRPSAQVSTTTSHQLPSTAMVVPAALSGDTTTTAAMSLECRESLGSVSPVAPASMGVECHGVAGCGNHRPGVKRKNTEDGTADDVESRLRSGANVAYVTHGSSRVVERPPPAKIFVPMMEGSCVGGGGGGEEYGDESENYPASPLHSLASVAVAAAAASQHNSPLCVNSISNSSAVRRMANSALNNKTMIANAFNIWIPPRMDQIDKDGRVGTPDSVTGRELGSKQLMEAGICGIDYVGSNRSAEETSSISTGRSESATPILRTGASINATGPNGVAASPVPLSAITHCQLCDVDFLTSTDLQVHFHTDHVVMRDGKDYKCPRYNCDRVYPSRETLRLHIIAHYFGGVATAPDDEPGIADSPSDSASCGGASPALHKKSSVLHTPTVVIPSAPAHSSPGTPEETRTSKRATESGTKQQANRKQGSAFRNLSANSGNYDSSNTTSPGQEDEKCDLCGQVSANAIELNSHYSSAHGRTNPT